MGRQRVEATGWVKYAPFVTFFGPIIGALIGAAITYYVVVARKQLTFWVTESEDVTAPLKRQYRDISFNVSGRQFATLNRSSVFVKSTGNRSTGELKFDIEMPGEHIEYLADIETDDGELKRAIKVSWVEPRQTVDPRFNVTVSPFMKPKESFKILLYFDGVAENCLVHCRLDDVSTTVKNGEYVSFWSAFARAQPQLKAWITLAAALAGVGMAATGKAVRDVLETLLPSFLSFLFH
jgi:hypothetical protein